MCIIIIPTEPKDGENEKCYARRGKQAEKKQLFILHE
jgi:hypothetical protein